MSRHQRPASSSNTRSRIVLGSAMTAVFLSGGAGVAMADQADQRGTGNVDLDATSQQKGLGGLVNAVTGNTGQLLSGNSFGNDLFNDNDIRILSPGERDHEHQRDHDKKRDHDHKWNQDDCDEDEPQRWHDSDKDDEDDDEADEAKNEKDDEKADDEKADDEKADEKDDTKADEKADEKAEDKDEVEAAKSDDSTPEVETVAAETTSPSSDTTPVGAADTGDGSFMPVAPVASTWSMADTMFAAGGGLGAAALLAGAGVGVGRHRRSSHRASV